MKIIEKRDKREGDKVVIRKKAVKGVPTPLTKVDLSMILAKQIREKRAMGLGIGGAEGSPFSLDMPEFMPPMRKDLL